jgi:hypothetical protein
MVGDWLRSPELQGLAALATVATAAAVLLGWLNRRRHAPEPVEHVRFSGRTRKAFLKRVWSQRIENGLNRSLKHAAEMHLGVQNAPELVKLFFLQSTAEAGKVMSIEAAYHRAGGQLLILGPPGSGKTTEALKLMRYLLRVARRDPSAPVPELFPLTAWARERKPILEWLADQMRIRHGWPLPKARSLIRQHGIMPVLDAWTRSPPSTARGVRRRDQPLLGESLGGSVGGCSRPTEYKSDCSLVVL